MRGFLTLMAAAIVAAPVAAALGLAPPPMELAPLSSDAPASDPASGAQIVDPEGDARVWNAQEIATIATLKACNVDYPRLYPLCLAGSAAPAEGGLPAPAAMDIVAVRFSDTPQHLVVEIEVAGLDAEFSEVARDDKSEWTAWDVCWTAADVPCNAWVSARAWRANGVLDLRAVYAHSYLAPDPDGSADTGCNYWWLCYSAIGLEVVPGSPGKLRMSVPRELLLEGEAGATLGDPSAVTRRFTHLSAAFLGENDPGGVVWWMYGPQGWDSGSQGTRTRLAPVDLTDTGASYVMTTPREDGGVARERLHVIDLREEFIGAPKAQRLDIVDVTLVETPQTLEVTVQLAEVPVGAGEQWLWMVLGTPGEGRIYAVVAASSAGEWAGHASYPTDWTYAHLVDVPVNLTVTPGSPGMISWEIERKEFEPIAAGDMLTIGWIVAGEGDTEIEQGVSPVARAHLELRNDETYDEVELPTFRFRYASTPPPSAAGLYFEDDVNDVTAPPGFFDQSALRSFDIASLHVREPTPDRTQITLGMADLSHVAVPVGYDAIVYGVGADIGRDTPLLIAYYKARDGRQEFFCAQDTLVLADTKTDPMNVVRQTIDGILAGGGNGGASGVTFLVPPSCYADENGGFVTPSRVVAASFVIRAPGGVQSQVETMDELEASGPITLGAVAPPTPDVAWWDAPLGIREFWNILGIAIAVAGGGVAVAARLHRRTVLERQLRAVEEAHTTHRAHPLEWRKAMAARRALVGELLQRRRLRPDEVLVVERRIELLSAEVAEPAKALQPATTGTLLAGRYRIHRLLGEGAQGRAFLAEDTTLRRDVVVKTVHMAGLDPTAKRALLAEARLAAGISHPNVVQVHDVLETDEDALLILEYVVGGTLRALLERSSPLPRAEAVRIARDVLAGLQAAHERGVIHRDVKPENILLTKERTAKLGDFGAARDTGRDATLVSGGLGTLPYMSPEQVRGQRVDARSDVYSVGAVLYEMLTGEHYLPIQQADEFQARAMILERAPVLRLREDALALTGVLLRALSKDATERFASAAELRAAIDSAMVQ